MHSRRVPLSSLPAVALAATIAAFGSSAAAPPSLVVPDGTAGLPDGGSSVFFPWSIVVSDAGSYGLEAALQAQAPPWIEIDAAWEISNGTWWLSVAQTSTLGSATFGPSDIFEWNVQSDSFSLVLSAAALGVPESSNIDALSRDPATGDLVLSFDRPTTFGSETYQPADLARYDIVSGLSDGVFFDASAFGIPDDVNLTAAEARGLQTVFALDTFVTVDGTASAPGDLLVWDGTTVERFRSQPGWPAGSRVNALSFEGSPGIVPPTILMDKVDSTTLRIRFSPSECSGAAEHAIYQGNIASLPAYDHTAIDCIDSGTKLEEDVAMPSGDVYFLVVPTSSFEEGSYGRNSFGAERPPGATTCAAFQNLQEC